jgi:hypothetical protein
MTNPPLVASGLPAGEKLAALLSCTANTPGASSFDTNRMALGVQGYIGLAAVSCAGTVQASKV